VIYHLVVDKKLKSAAVDGHVNGSKTSMTTYKTERVHALKINLLGKIGGFHSSEIKYTLFFVVEQCSLVDKYRCFKGTCCFLLQGARGRWRHHVPLNFGTDLQN
jgi:hypothetical protein